VNPQIQLQRLMKRNDLTKKVALERIRSQMSMDEKKTRADFVIVVSLQFIGGRGRKGSHKVPASTLRACIYHYFFAATAVQVSFINLA